MAAKDREGEEARGGPASTSLSTSWLLAHAGALFGAGLLPPFQLTCAPFTPSSSFWPSSEGCTLAEAGPSSMLRIMRRIVLSLATRRQAKSRMFCRHFLVTQKDMARRFCSFAWRFSRPTWSVSNQPHQLLINYNSAKLTVWQSNFIVHPLLSVV